MKNKTYQTSKQTHKGIEPLRNYNGVRNSDQKAEQPDKTAKLMIDDYHGSHNFHNGCGLVRELHRSCSTVQFFGVTAAVIAFLAFVLPNFDVLKANLFRTGLCCTPLILAYVLSFNHLILTDDMFNNPKLLLMICWLIYFLDALLLGALVAMTGGPSESLFIPLFLLIPTAMSCYCNPKRWPYWTIILTVVIAYVIAACVESTDWVIVEGADKQPEEWIRQLISGVFTISCVMIAAYCCVVTHKVRKRYCSSRHKVIPNICDELCF